MIKERDRDMFLRHRPRKRNPLHLCRYSRYFHESMSDSAMQSNISYLFVSACKTVIQREKERETLSVRREINIIHARLRTNLFRHSRPPIFT